MFTGLIEEMGSIASISQYSGGKKLELACKHIKSDLKIDDSVAVNGVCLTAVELTDKGFIAIAVEETLRKTGIGNLKQGSKVNLERALTLSTRLGGHLVAGHVDCIGTISNLIVEGANWLYDITIPKHFAKYLTRTGSVCIDGISLTVADAWEDKFRVAIIPHTLAVTSMGERKVGDSVNLEFDVLAKYLESLITKSDLQNQTDKKILDFLQTQY